MPLRKKELYNASDASRKRPMRNQQQSGQDVVVISDSDDEDSDFRPSSSTRGERREERDKARPKEMTEEEMLELAMKLSEQEASNTAHRRHQEEEAVRKAIAQSLSQADSPTQPGLQVSPDHSPSEGIPTGPASRRRLLYPHLGVRRKMKVKRKSSPLAEMPDLSQHQSDCSQTSASSSISHTKVFLSLADSQLDPQEGRTSSTTERNAAAGPAHSTVSSPAHSAVAYPSHNTQGHASDSAPQPSPTSLTSAPPSPKPVVVLPRLSQDMLSDCQNSGFFRCAFEPGTSQTSPLRSLQPPLHHINTSPVPCWTGPGRRGEEEEEDLQYSLSPVFSGSNQKTGGGGGGGGWGQTERPGKAGADRQGCEENGENGGEEGGEEEWEEDRLHHSASPSFPSTNQKPSLQNQQNSRGALGSDVLVRSSPGSVPQQSHSQQPRAGQPSNGGRPSGGQARQTTHTFSYVHVPDCGGRVCVTSPVSLEKMAPSAKLALEEELELESQALVAALGSQSILELTSDMALRWSDEDEVEPTNSTTSPSPVFPKEGTLQLSQQSTSPAPHPIPPALSPGPSPQKRSLTPDGELHGEEGCVAKRARRQGASTGAQGDGRSARSGDPGDAPAVTYYWGVPFCPRGENPDTYTQVILCQLEVYEKSLKEAQHGLYRKAEWGPPVLPGAPQRPRARGERHSATLEQRDEEEEEEQEGGGGEREKRKGARERGRRGKEDKGRRSPDEESCDPLLLSSPERKEKSPSPIFGSSPELFKPRRRPGLRRGRGGETTVARLDEPRGRAGTTKQPAQEEEEEEEGEENGKEQNEEEEGMEEEEAGSCVVCPESQLSDEDDDITQDLMVTSPTEQARQAESQVLPRIQSFLPGQPQPKPQQQLEGMEVEQLEEKKEEEEEEKEESMEGSGPTSPARGGDRNVRLEEEEQMEEQEEEQEGAPPSSMVDCPLCMAPFPLGEIEMHAAYCDGSFNPAHSQRQPDTQQVSLKPCRKRTRKGEIIGAEQPSSSSSAKEKCFICKHVFPLREYDSHVEYCLQGQGQAVDLLSALEQTESRASVTTGNRARESSLKTKPSQTNSRPHHDNDDEEEGGAGDPLSALRGSSSPIRAFTPISEANDCLIDFARQYSGKPPSQRGARKRRHKR